MNRSLFDPLFFVISWSPIIDFVESKYEEYLTAESRVHRKAISDSRVHCCLYFIAPSGHGLKMLDIEFSKYFIPLGFHH